MDDVVFTVNIPTTYTREDIESIIIGAVEGGINYWGDVTGYSTLEEHIEGGTCSNIREIGTCEIEAVKQLEFYSEKIACLLLNGYVIYFQDVEDEDEIFGLTLDMLQKGIEIHHQRSTKSRKDNYDADDYDGIIQRALFGRVVYG